MLSALIILYLICLFLQMFFKLNLLLVNPSDIMPNIFKSMTTPVWGHQWVKIILGIISQILKTFEENLIHSYVLNDSIQILNFNIILFQCVELTDLVVNYLYLNWNGQNCHWQFMLLCNTLSFWGRKWTSDNLIGNKINKKLWLMQCLFNSESEVLQSHVVFQ